MTNKIITVLYVDDEPINTKLFALNFRNLFNVLTADSGYTGLVMLKEHPEISVVISDMKMPGMNGIEFIGQAKKEFPNIIFFILTGYEITEEIADAIKINLINKYFQKPFNSNEIESSINQALKLLQ